MDGTVLFPEPMYSLDHSTLSSSFTLVGQIQNPAQLFLVQNLTNATVDFSMDGTNTHFQLPANGYIVLDVGTNRTVNRPLSFSALTALFAKGSAAAGQVNLTSFYVR